MSSFPPPTKDMGLQPCLLRDYSRCLNLATPRTLLPIPVLQNDWGDSHLLLMCSVLLLCFLVPHLVTISVTICVGGFVENVRGGQGKREFLSMGVLKRDSVMDTEIKLTMLRSQKRRELESEGLAMNPVATIYSCGQTSAPIPVRWGDCENQVRACGEARACELFTNENFAHPCIHICIEV